MGYHIRRRLRHKLRSNAVIATAFLVFAALLIWAVMTLLSVSMTAPTR